jgi:hypothetical protein
MTGFVVVFLLITSLASLVAYPGTRKNIITLLIQEVGQAYVLIGSAMNNHHYSTCSIYH